MKELKKFCRFFQLFSWDFYQKTPFNSTVNLTKTTDLRSAPPAGVLPGYTCDPLDLLDQHVAEKQLIQSASTAAVSRKSPSD